MQNRPKNRHFCTIACYRFTKGQQCNSVSAIIPCDRCVPGRKMLLTRALALCTQCIDWCTIQTAWTRDSDAQTTLIIFRRAWYALLMLHRQFVTSVVAAVVHEVSWCPSQPHRVWLRTKVVTRYNVKMWLRHEDMSWVAGGIYATKYNTCFHVLSRREFLFWPRH